MIHPADVGGPCRCHRVLTEQRGGQDARPPPSGPNADPVTWHRVDLTEGLAMILVTGATGNIGRPLVDLLVGEGAKVRAATRNPQAAGLPAGVEVVEGDPARPDTIAPFLDGVTGLFVNPRSVGIAAGDLLALAQERGVQRAVALSARNVDDDPARQPSRYQGDRNKEVEDAVTRSGLEWVSLRVGYFATNTLMWAGQIRAGDVVRGSYAASTGPATGGAPIDPRDVAAVGARALLSDALVGQRPVLTGPQSLTQEEMVAVIGEVIGRPLRYQEIPPEAAKQGMIGLGLSEGFVDAYLSLLAEAVGQPALVSDEVDKALGRPARTYAEWVADHAAAFRAPGS
jgi:uncharacterized protein YbjT (DUF2867 family)